MFGFFQSRKSLLDSGLLPGSVDNHSHILYGVDDGVGTKEESLSILEYLGQAGVKTLWLTPHIMEDVPNKTSDLKKRFETLKSLYSGPIELHLASENMIDTLFEKRLEDRDLLTHGGDRVLVETSTIAPPIDLWEVLERMMKYGYRPIVAHPERYHYMDMPDYSRLHDMGVLLQLNLPSILGVYGESAMIKAQMLLDKGWYSMAGSDCHRFRAIKGQFSSKVLRSGTIRQLEPIMKGTL